LPTRFFPAFACPHFTNERLYVHQIRALPATDDCKMFVCPKQSLMAAMAKEILANTPECFTLIEQSLGSYTAFEVIRSALSRLKHLESTSKAID